MMLQPHEISLAASKQLAERIDDEIRSVLGELWGPVWSMYDVRARCEIVRIEGSPIETLYVDGKPALEFHPIKCSLDREDGKFVFKVTRDVRRLTVGKSGE